MAENDWMSYMSRMVRQLEDSPASTLPPQKDLQDTQPGDPHDFPAQAFVGKSPRRDEARAFLGDVLHRYNTGLVTTEQVYKEAYEYARKNGYDPDTFAQGILGNIQSMLGLGKYYTPRS